MKNTLARFSSVVSPTNGEVIHRERLGAAGQYMASPVIADDRLYLFSAKGVLTVVRCGDQSEIVHHTDHKASIAATPGMDQNSLYERSDEALLCFRRLGAVSRLIVASSLPAK